MTVQQDSKKPLDSSARVKSLCSSARACDNLRQPVDNSARVKSPRVQVQL